jgi:hypothetical protein
VEIPALIDWIDTHHGTSYALVGTLGGTRSSWLLRDAAAAKAVLKRGPTPAALHHLTVIVSVIAQVNARDYPAPRYLYCGPDDAGRRYTVQQFMPGHQLGILSPDALDVMFALNDRHANLYLETTQDWATYVRATVYEGDSGWADTMRTHSTETAGQQLTRRRSVAASGTARSLSAARRRS